MEIHNYSDFVKALEEAGFALAGGSADGIYSIIPWGWDAEAPYETEVAWHSGDPDLDPWIWRLRVLEEDGRFAYGKVFFKKGGFITRHWVPYFLKIRRKEATLKRAFQEGHVSQEAKAIYEVIRRDEPVPLHALKSALGITGDRKAAFDRALVELQMGLWVTISGARAKQSRDGQDYGWSSTVFVTTETFWGEEVFREARGLTEGGARAAITEQILRLNPEASPSKIRRFING